MFKIQEVTTADIAFGGDMKTLLPKWEDIPEEFKKSNKWTPVFTTWMFKGLPSDVEFHGKEGVDPKKAFNHIRAIMVSFAPKHEHKEAGITYLMDQWFTEIKNYEGGYREQTDIQDNQ